MQQLLVTPAELAAILSLSQGAIYHGLHTKGDLPTVIRLGRLPRFAVSDVDAWLAAKSNASPSSIEQSSMSARRRGRPTKAAQIALHQAGGGV
jgi:predicted DNA-binding transcriptional regulator AlpA